MLEQALRYAKRGWHVFPAEGKVPLNKGGFTRASADERQIRKWWERWPDAWVAISTELSNLVVIDIDRKNGVDGLMHFAKVAMKVGKDSVPQTLQVNSPSGGLHLYYLKPDYLCGPIQSTQGRLGAWECPGVDVKAKGGCITAPPSPGYEWGEKMEPLELPKKWAAALQREPWRPPSTPPPNFEQQDRRAMRYAQAGIEAEILELARTSQGGRNAQLFKSAAALGRFIGEGNVREGDLVPLLLSACSDNGLLEEEGEKACRQTIKSGLKAAMAGHQRQTRL